MAWTYSFDQKKSSPVGKFFGLSSISSELFWISLIDSGFVFFDKQSDEK